MCDAPFEPVFMDLDIAAHACGEVDERVDITFPDEPDDIPVKPRFTRIAPGLWVAHVDVHDGGAGPGSLDGTRGDVFGRDRAIRIAAGLVVVTGDGAGDDDIAVHGIFHNYGYIIVIIQRALRLNPCDRAIPPFPAQGP